ncbi:GerAB/ArcD/ProY family transporter [Bacillus sp. Cr_A10]|uniref:GerAB/ArcD/ProY family transporter n=1 Tax=Bacillus sp. Cr_A10 TaxID=3033993 RepID=UPI0023DAA609|nr:GerAB/ArcD/ProY family transporter [Bacillus sp. Cr_A10]MDF2067670.1 GerAB/ArcD/ProY family transporter [Bacillus sp. Cr_A10]
MSTNKRKLLNDYHVVFLAQSAMFGTGILSLPQRLSSLGYSEAFFPLVLGIIASLTLWPMIWIMSKFPNENLFRINELLLSKWIGKSINIFFVLQFTLFLAAIISNYMQLIQTTALPEQKITAPIFLLILILIYIVKGGIKSIARFCMMAFFLTLPLLYFLRWSIEKGDVSHIFPLFNYNFKEMFEALRKGYLSILGYETILFYYPYIVNQKKAFKHVSIGIWISIILCLITTFVSVMYYSEWQLKNVEFSVLQLFKAGELTFIERIDIIGMTMWVFLVLSTMAIYLWSAKKGLDSIRSKKNKLHVYIIATVVFLIIIFPYSNEMKQKLYEVSFYAGYLLVVWPIFLSIVHVLRKKKVQQ